MGYLVSVLLPTRNRPKSLIESVESLVMNAENIDDIQILLKIDDDDYSYWNIYPRLYEITPHIKIIISPRGNGYWDLHKYVNNLCSIADGQYLFLWNDDALMQTSGWDSILRENESGLFGEPTKIIFFETNTWPTIFPIIHRNVYEILGHFSLMPHNDGWIVNVGINADMTRYEPRIKAIHDRFDATGNHNDTTYSDQYNLNGVNPYETINEVWYSMDMILNRLEDINKLRDYAGLDRLNNSNYIKEEANLINEPPLYDFNKFWDTHQVEEEDRYYHYTN